jgi:pimeloyl-ACP methyl ester carboxylesterase
MILNVVLFMGCISVNVDNNVLFANKVGVSIPEDVKQEYVYLKSYDNTNLESISWTTRNPEFNFILFPGQTGFNPSYKLLYSELSKKEKINMICFNYRGYGLSEGTPDYQSILMDIEPQLDYARQVFNNDKPIIIIGHSLGSHFTLYSSKYLKVNAKIILISPFSDMTDIITHFKKDPKIVPQILVPFIKIKVPEDIKNISNISLIENINKQILIIHGKKDSNFPVSMSKKLISIKTLSKLNLEEIDNIGHEDMIERKNIEKLSLLIWQFLKS